MKKLSFTLLFILMIAGTNLFAQDKYGNTLNAGVGIGYRWGGPVLHANYEFDLAKNFTLAPFITFYSYRNHYYWGDNNKNYPYRDYYYRETVIPIGVKGSYYFDQLINVDEFDFYVAGSLGFAFRTRSWDNGYYGDRNIYRSSSPLYLDLHVGTEYHINSNLGVYLDLSTGLSTLGLAVHLK